MAPGFNQHLVQQFLGTGISIKSYFHAICPPNHGQETSKCRDESSISPTIFYQVHANLQNVTIFKIEEEVRKGTKNSGKPKNYVSGNSERVWNRDLCRYRNSEHLSVSTSQKRKNEEKKICVWVFNYFTNSACSFHDGHFILNI